MKPGSRLVALFASVLLLSSEAHAAVKASLDNDQVAPGDTVQLMLEHDGQVNAQPDLAPLKADFDVLGSSRSSNVQIINGSMSSTTQLQLTLAPKHNGQITVPSIEWGGDRSAPLTLNVSAAAGGANSSDKSSGEQTTSGKIFMETTVDNKQPYVQAAVAVTVRLYTAQPLYQATMELPATSDVLVQQIGKDSSSNSDRNGQRYQVIERHYLVFPQHSGHIDLAGAVLDAQIAARTQSDVGDDDAFANVFGRAPFGNMVTQTRPIRIHGDPVVLNVHPRPADANSSYWLPARNVTVTAQWHPDSLQVHVGEPLTVDLHLQAEGLTAAQLPDLASLLKLPTELKAYPDQAKLDNSIQGDAVLGSRQQSIALIADQPGKFNLPPLHIHWWDTRSNTARETTVPGQVLTILPNPSGTPTTEIPLATNNNQSINNTAHSSAMTAATSAQYNYWRWISLVLGLLWIATLLAWYGSYHYRTRSAVSKVPKNIAKRISPSEMRSEFHNACRSNNARLARRKLLDWLAATQPDTSVVGLRAFAKQMNDDKITPLLLELERAAYTATPWNGVAMLEALNELPQPQVQRRNSNSDIPSLYD